VGIGAAARVTVRARKGEGQRTDRAVTRREFGGRSRLGISAAAGIKVLDGRALGESSRQMLRGVSRQFERGRTADRWRIFRRESKL
jgi:hypothetical protein